MLLHKLYKNMAIANILHLLKIFYDLPNIIFQIPEFLLDSQKKNHFLANISKTKHNRAYVAS